MFDQFNSLYAGKRRSYVERYQTLYFFLMFT